MDQHFTYSEQVDRYLKGKLSASERAAFDEKIQQDPLLQNNVKLQQEIFQAIGETRKANIKARLNQIPIEQSPWLIGSPFRVAAVVSGLLVASVGTYLTLTPSDSTFNPVDIASPETLSAKEQPIVQAPKPATVLEPIPDVVIPEPNESTLVADARPTTIQRSATRELPTVRRPAVATEFSEDAIQVDYSDFEMPQKQALQANDAGETNISIERIVDKVYSFHYQFYDDKLFLHGDFAEEPYKIIALNTKSDRNLFLRYAENYYLLEEQTKISPMILIRDTTLVKQLNKLSAID
ncbi:hypothetical protein [Tunicatimonas pelagia]|uniref:hypothetical protein n=1 Tax=Tunicatimonas pelagia TaxID=931531 RepID=UPI002665A0B7|nr:hypothetical protein [Tunicatimonas pelagia]WKN41592.1 hypothetical protein P0M28_21385 [Tunicatimonas pelagia]